MQLLKQKIESHTGKRGIEYNGMIDDKASETLKDVNNVWSQYDFVITNNKVTVGVNYDNSISIFDVVFVSLAGFSSPRDVVQSSRRCRHNKEKVIKVLFLDSVNTNTSFKSDIDKYDCAIYKRIIFSQIGHRSCALLV